MAAARRGAGRPKEPVLSRELIVETGLRLLDEKGDSGAAIREIARELGVRPSALYNHVSGREDLISGIRDLICARMDTGGFDELPWDEALVRWADSYREAFSGHTLTIAFFAVTPLEPDSGTTQMFESVLRGLVRGGWPENRALSLVVAFESFLLGSALDAGADPDMLDPGDSGASPVFAAAFAARREHTSSRGSNPADDAYRLGRDALIAGLRAELAALRG